MFRTRKIAFKQLLSLRTWLPSMLIPHWLCAPAVLVLYRTGLVYGGGR
jgi:hypothetical protein